MVAIGLEAASDDAAYFYSFVMEKLF